MSVVLFACGGSSPSRQSKQSLRDSARYHASTHSVSKIYYSVPSPIEVAHVVQSTGVEYEARLLHKPELGMRYSTNLAAALNLGIYGADLSYSIYFDQQQVALNYLDCIKELTSGLDIIDTTIAKKFIQIEENIRDKEKLKKVVNQTFFHSDALLKENSRRPTAMLVALGMWVECLYISTQLTNMDAAYNPQLTKCIVEQGLVFDDVQGMLSILDETPDVDYVKKELESVKSSFVNINKSLGGTYVVSTEEFAVDSKLFTKLCDEVCKVRTNFTQLF